MCWYHGQFANIPSLIRELHDGARLERVFDIPLCASLRNQTRKRKQKHVLRIAWPRAAWASQLGMGVCMRGTTAAEPLLTNSGERDTHARGHPGSSRPNECEWLFWCLTPFVDVQRSSIWSGRSLFISHLDVGREIDVSRLKGTTV